ncbi:MAG: shikimate kinase [Flavobacteriaceae bacterium]|jgi:shikimate kinase|nr:shikimate kinase [Flavobacteriaceae bacterium]
MIISLTGYMGSGKTTVGKLLAKYLNFVFIDLDDYIISNEKRSITELFSGKGEIYFRKVENSCLREILNKDNIVLSLGGGTPVYHDNMDLINDKSISFYLKMNPLELAKRLIPEKEHRPLISHLNDENIEEFIAKHLFERSPYYEKAKYKININHRSVEETCNEIIALLKISG